MPTNDERFPSPRLTRIALILGVPLAVAVGPQAVAWALTPLKMFSANDKLSAADVNANFKTLADGVTALETKKPVAKNPANGKTISIGATFCGVTPQAIVGSAIGGYDKAAQSCQVATGCQSSASTHMCTAEEMLRSRAIGLDIPSSWYSTGVAVVSNYNTMEHGLNDCSEWTSAVANQQGPEWNAGGAGGPGFAGCSSPAPIACCD
jgi:hypothetical protein